MKFTPIDYILRDSWRKRSRTILSIAGLAVLSFLFVLFASMQEGLSDYDPDEDEEHTLQEKEDLLLIKDVMNKWIYLISILCWTLMVLVVANTSGITVIERKHELATLRAIGLSGIQVSLLVIGGMAVVVYSGIISGMLLGIAFIPILDGANLVLWEAGTAFPFSFNVNTILITLGIGTVSGIIGLIPPLVMVNRSAPAEVLRDAG
ncbi:MAG: ABC transporter permease [Thermoplasmatota archaeon]